MCGEVMDVEYEDELDMYYDKWLALKHRVKMLESGPGGIMEMKQTIADKEAKIVSMQKTLDHYRGVFDD
jgi:hypothetical protein